MKKIIIVFVSFLLILGCVTTSTLKLDPRVLNGQDAISKDGIEAVVSQKKAKVTIQPLVSSYSSNDLPTIVVSVYSGEQAFDLSTEDIQVSVDGNSHAIVTYDELVEEIKRKEKVELKKMERDNDQRMRGAGSSSDAVNYIKVQYQKDVDAVKSETEKSIKALDRTMLKKTTVKPGKEYSGQVTLAAIPNPSQSHEVKVVVTAAGEKHEFLLNQLNVK
jgi:hypothetical protein